LHHLRIEALAIENDGERVTGQRNAREYIEDMIAAPHSKPRILVEGKLKQEKICFKRNRHDP
jgi:hypothetical protein